MWKIYVLIFALGTQSIKGQQIEPITNSEGRLQVYNGFNNNLHSSIINNNDTITRSAQLPGRKYNANTRDSFGSTHVLAESHLLSRTRETITKVPQQYGNDNIANNLPTTTLRPAVRKSAARNSFNAKLFDIMSLRATSENLVYSPISIQSLLTFISTLSDGRLYEELAQVLAISNNRSYVAQTFENVVRATALYAPPTTLIMASKFYYNYRYGPIDRSIHNLAQQSFASEIEQIDFSSSRQAVRTVNTWIGEKTRNLIQEIVTPSSISGDTSALLLNSIYFKSDWLTKFATDDTETQAFFVTKQKQVPVDMMYNEDVFRYGDFTAELQAAVVELPYKTPNLTMLLFLPTDIEGLAELERKLRYYDFQTISQKLKREIVIVKLPRFEVEYEIDMAKPLQEMGLNVLFSNSGSISLFRNQKTPLKIDQFKHKCLINVNEAGTEAAATTVAKYIPLSTPTDLKYFVADHPFLFVIRDSSTIFFMGHVVKF